MSFSPHPQRGSFCSHLQFFHKTFQLPDLAPRLWCCLTVAWSTKPLHTNRKNPAPPSSFLASFRQPLSWQVRFLAWAQAMLASHQTVCSIGKQCFLPLGPAGQVGVPPCLETSSGHCHSASNLRSHLEVQTLKDRSYVHKWHLHHYETHTITRLHT